MFASHVIEGDCAAMYNSIGAEDPELPLWRGSAVDATRLALMSRTEGLKDTMWEGIGGINEMGSTINLM